MPSECECCGASYDDPVVPELGRIPWSVRLVYAWRAILGGVRPIGPVDVSHLQDEGYMEGRVRLTVRKVRR